MSMFTFTLHVKFHRTPPRCAGSDDLAPRLVPLIRRERDLDRLVEWTVASGRLSRTAFAALFSGM
jgi:hypothetical protein